MSSRCLVRHLADLPLSYSFKARSDDKICEVIRDVFLAAATTQATAFQLLPNVFELFGLGFIVSNDEKTYLLEINSVTSHCQFLELTLWKIPQFERDWRQAGMSYIKFIRGYYHYCDSPIFKSAYG